MTDDSQVDGNLKGMDVLDFEGWNNADWHGVFAHHHTEDVLVDFKGMDPTRGIQEHIDAMEAFVESAGGTPPQITSHPIGSVRASGPVSLASSRTVTAWSLWPSGATARSPRSTSGPDVPLALSLHGVAT